jgi:hypothetical protein
MLLHVVLEGFLYSWILTRQDVRHGLHQDLNVLLVVLIRVHHNPLTIQDDRVLLLLSDLLFRWSQNEPLRAPEVE